MKILQINSVCGIGSTGRIATDIHEILIKNGHNSKIAYGRDEAKNCNNTIKIGNKKDLYSHVLKTRLFDKHGFGSKKATKKFIKEIEKYNPDVIHLHNIHGYYLNVEILFNYLKKINKPVVWTLHDCWAFTGHCAYFDYANCNKWEIKCNKCPQKRSYPASYFIDNSKKNYKLKKELFNGVNNLTIVTPSEWLATIVKKSFLKEYPIKVINNGIDLNVFKPTETSFREVNAIKNKFIILGVASVWEERKGLKYFIELSKELEEDEVIVIVGLTNKQLELLPDNIIGITRTNNTKELAEIYSTADVFVNPTLEDNFPTTNIESLACGTPVITFNTGGSPECIDKETGIVVEKGNLLKLRKAIKNLKNKNIESNKCIARSQKFDKTDKFNEYIELYDKILKK